MKRHFNLENIQMRQVRFEDCSTSLAIREMQMKTTMRYYYTPIRITKIKIAPTPRAAVDEEKLHCSYIAGR